MQSILDIITGEAGVFGVLVLLITLLLNGRLVPKDYVNDIKEENTLLKKTLTEQTDSINTLVKSADESLENSRTTLKILSAVRDATGVKGEEDDKS